MVDSVTAAFSAIFWMETFCVVALVAVAAYFAMTPHR